MNFKHYALLILSAWGVSACSTKDYKFDRDATTLNQGNVNSKDPNAIDPNSKTGTDRFSLDSSRKTPVDFIFVIDNSGSMGSSQNIVKMSFASFIQKFDENGIDYRIGMITTNAAPPEWWSNSGNINSYYRDYVRPERGHFLNRFSGNPWLSSDDPEVVSKFKSNADLGAHNNAEIGQEQGIASLLYAISPDNLNGKGFNSGFIRNNALLSVVFVTDEDEAMADGETVPEKLIDRLITRSAEIKGSGTPGYRYDFVLDKNAQRPGTISYPLTSNVTNYPNVYLKAAEKLKSSTYNIRKDFSGDLLKIADSVVKQATRQFKLARKPLISSITVSVAGGKRVPLAEMKDVKFLSDQNSIEVTEEFLQGEAGKAIDVFYDVH